MDYIRKFSKFILISLMFVFVGVAFCSCGKQLKSFSVSGYILSENGPVVGAEISSEIGSTQSDENGYYEFSGLISGISLIVSHDQYYFPSAVKTAFSQASNLNFNGFEYYSVCGKVLSGEGNNNISGAKIVANGIVSCFSYSNNEGEFKIENLAGKIEISAQKDGFQFEKTNISLDSKDEIIVFDGKTSVSVSAIGEGGEKFSGYSLAINKENFLDNEKADLEDIEIGTVLTPMLSGYKFIPSNATVTHENQQISFEVYKLYGFSSSILSGKEKLNNVEVFVDGKPCTTSNGGVFTLSNIYGEHKLSFSLSGYSFTPVIINSEFFPTEIQAQKIVHTKILDENNKPISGVIVKSNNETTISDENGFFDLFLARVGDKIEFEKTGYQFNSVELGSDSLNNVYGSTKYNLSVLVTYNEKPLSNVAVEIDGDNSSIYKTDEFGKVYIENLISSRMVSVSNEGYYFAESNACASNGNCELVFVAEKIYNFSINLDPETTCYFDGKKIEDINGLIQINNIYGTHQLKLVKENFNEYNCLINEFNLNITPNFTYSFRGVIKTGDFYVEDVEIFLNGDKINQKTGAKGEFLLTNLTGKNSITFSKDGYSIEEIKIANGLPKEINAFYTIYGRCGLGDNQNVANIEIKLLGENSDVKTTLTNNQGEFSFEGLSGGYTLYVPPNEADNRTKEFTSIKYEGINSYGAYNFINNAYKITGFVTCGDIPVRKVQVTAGEYVSYTNDEGKYTFSSLSDENIPLQLFKEGYTFSGEKFVVSSKDSASSIDFESTYMIKGKTKSGKNVLSGVSVSVDGKNVLSDENGYFKLSDLTANNSISFSKQGYNFSDINIEGYEFLEVNGSYFVDGYVKTGDIPVQNVKISSSSGSVFSNELGYFKIEKLVGDEELKFELESYNFEPIVVNSYQSNMLCWGTYNVFGVVKNGEEFLENVKVFVDGVEKAQTNSNGKFEVRNISGEVQITFQCTNFNIEPIIANKPFNKIISTSFAVSGYVKLGDMALSNVRVSSGEKYVLTNDLGYYELGGLSGSGVLSLTKEGYTFSGVFDYNGPMNLDFSALYSISGVIKSGSLKISGAVISYGNGNSVQSNAIGEFSIAGLSSSVSLSVNKEGYRNYNSNLSFSDSASNLEIQLGYRIAGKVVSNRSVDQIKVDVKDYYGEKSTVTNNSGEFSFDEIYGNAEIKFSKTGFGFSSVFCSKEKTDISVNPTVLYSITGVVKAGSYGIGEAQVKAGSFGLFKTDSNGNFKIDNLSGTIVVQAILSRKGCTTFNSNQLTISDSSNLTFNFNINDYCFYMYEQGFQRMKESTYETSLTGEVKLSVGGTQKVGGAKKKGKDGNITFEQINYGAEVLGIDPKIAVLSYYDPASSNNIKYKETKNVSSSCVATYGASWNTKSYSDYKNTFGIDVQGFFAYIISQSTISNVKDVKKDGSQMQFTFVLNTSTSTGNYIKNMYKMSEQTPTGFNHIYLTLYYNSGNVIKSYIEEQYTIKKGITVTANGYLTETYKITNGSTVIPKY